MEVTEEVGEASTGKKPQMKRRKMREVEEKGTMERRGRGETGKKTKERRQSVSKCEDGAVRWADSQHLKKENAVDKEGKVQTEMEEKRKVASKVSTSPRKRKVFTMEDERLSLQRSQYPSISIHSEVSGLGTLSIYDKCRNLAGR